MEEFDLIVVGAGLAGSSAAYTAARAGLNVVLVERGAQPGTKTVSGGLLYSHALGRMFPEFWKEEPRPVERAIDRNVLSFLTPTQATSLDYFDLAYSQPPFNAFSVLRSRLDRWIAQKAESAGAVPVYGLRVDELLREQGRVVGIRADTDELRAPVVLLAEGSNTVLSRAAGQQPESRPATVGIGVKQVIGLPPGEVERRFQLRGLSGTQYSTIGFPPGLEGGGFLYTNQESISFGLILNLRAVAEGRVPMYEVIEQYKAHPFLSRLLEGGTLLEYSGCIVDEGGFDRRVAEPFGDGYLVAGSGAGYFLNTGFTLRGMDFALESGRLAGEASVRAVRAKDPSKRMLSSYGAALAGSFVLRELLAHRGYPRVFGNPRLYELYPKTLNALMHRLTFVGGEGRPHLGRLLLEATRGEGSALALLGDLARAARTL